MNWTQCQRWRGFSVRMARRGWPSLTESRKRKIEDYVARFFECRVYDGEWREMFDWDGADGKYLCDQTVEHFDDILGNKPGPDGTYETKFINQIQCCIRAGFDCAVAPSGGVVGFDVGDLKRMYPEGVPFWIHSEYEGLAKAKNTDPIWL